jgi:hypothetical protein
MSNQRLAPRPTRVTAQKVHIEQDMYRGSMRLYWSEIGALV